MRMTVMEPNQLNQQQQQQKSIENKIEQINLNANDTNINSNETPMRPIAMDDANSTTINSSRKNSNTESINNGVGGGSSNNQIPLSTLSLSSTSSAASSSANHRNNKHNSTSTPPLNHTSRRSSGNSITIKITNTENSHLDDIMNSNELEKFDENDELNENDRDEAEDTSSNSVSNDFSSSHSTKKKLKERKKLVRSFAQQQHQLNCQESEDLLDENHPINQEESENITEDMIHAQIQSVFNKNMNSAFDELFEAAQTGNIAKSAVIEAKMAAAAAAVEKDDDLANEQQQQSCRRSSIARSRNGSFRGSNRAVNSTTKENNNHKSLFIENNFLGAPNQLTRSVSCKRPGSFKRMKSRNASPNRPHNDNNLSINATPNLDRHSPVIVQRSSPAGSSNNNNNNTGRRGTQCSITIMDNLENGIQQNRAGSLPFEKMIGGDEMNMEQNNGEVYRVRQFHTTNNGLVINRGDSFKRSFKRSTHSITSNPNNHSPTTKKDNLLNLPMDGHDGYMRRISNVSNHDEIINETCFNTPKACEVLNENDVNNNTNNDGATHQNIKVPVINSQESVATYLVYLLGATSVGKNALIKQFYTSEYRGTYEINQYTSTDEETDEGVSVLLDGVESKIQFISFDIDVVKQVPNLYKTDRDNNAFIIVYSISDKLSFQVAIDLLKYIMVNEKKTQPIILVGNKSDLVRKRAITREDGRGLAIKYGCKFVETSVAINDKVDDLLAGILKQIRLSEPSNHIVETNDYIITPVVNKNNRNLSETDLYNIDSKKSSKSNNQFSFKTNTLRRFLMKQKNFKDELDKRTIGLKTLNNQNNNYQLSTNSTSRVNTLTCNNNQNKISSNNTGNFSFFQKIFKLFKKKQPNNQSNLQSVENLFSPSLQIIRHKRIEK